MPREIRFRFTGCAVGVEMTASDATRRAGVQTPAERGANGGFGFDGGLAIRSVPMQPRLLAAMVTTTSYGSWLPGDLRGYVDRGVTGCQKTIRVGPPIALHSL
jgi:hypothetical protein